MFTRKLGIPKKIFGVPLVSPRRRESVESTAVRREQSLSPRGNPDSNVNVLTVNEFIGRKKRPRPTEPEFIAYARYLGINPNQDSDLLWIAEEALWAPLPEEWTEHFDSDGRVFYFNMHSRTSSWLHPLEQMHRDLYLEITRYRRQDLSKEEQAACLSAWRRRCERAELDSQEEIEAWTQHVDEEGKTFYFNRHERRSAWTDPRSFRCHVLRLQLKALRVLCEHWGLEAAATASTAPVDEWPGLDATSMALVDEPVPDEREEQVLPYCSPRPKALHLLGGCYSVSPSATPRSEVGEVSADKAATMAAGECVVCLDAAASHIVVPCGHQALCRRCADRYFMPMPSPERAGRLRCPCCRRHIEQVIEVFVPKPRVNPQVSPRQCTPRQPMNTTQSL
jgi:centrosomal protein CEP164